MATNLKESDAARTVLGFVHTYDGSVTKRVLDITLSARSGLDAVGAEIIRIVEELESEGYLQEDDEGAYELTSEGRSFLDSGS